MTTKVDTIIQELKSLTLVEAAELVKQIELTFQVDATITSAPMTQEPTGGKEASDKEVEEQTEFSVILEEVPTAKKIPTLKVVRSITGLGLKDAKTLVESCPKLIKENTSKHTASEIKQKLDEAGAKAVIK